MPSASESLPPAPVPNAQQDLYRAALGPAHAEHYLPVFARFDERGASGPAWNTAAAAGSLGWLLYRQLWGAAGEFAAALAVWALIAAGLAFWVEVLPLGVRAGLALTLLLLLVAVPGLYGTALLYAQVRQRMVDAVKQAATVDEACTLLRWQGDAQRRRGARAVAGLLMAVGALGCALWFLPSALAPLPAAPVVDAVAASEPLADAPAEPAAAAPPVSVTDQEPLAPAVNEPAAADLPPSADAAPAGEAPASTLAGDASGAAPLQEVAAPVPAAVAPVPATAPTTAPPSAVAVRVKGYGVSVGLFAVADNAERARTKLEAAGLPVLIDPIESARGPITRVRVGPFENRAQAQAAAKKVGALGLDARVYAP
jgi:cell division septation protein DedD